MGPPPVPSAYHGSPSVGRNRGTCRTLLTEAQPLTFPSKVTNGASQRPPASTQGMALLGFQNSFDSPVGGSASRRSARAETMPPPPTGRGRGLTTPEKKSAVKGKSKMLVDSTLEEEADESVVLDSKGMSGWGAKGVGPGAGGMDDSRVEDDPDDDEDEEDEWMGFMRDRMGDVGLPFRHLDALKADQTGLCRVAPSSRRSSPIARSCTSKQTRSTSPLPPRSARQRSPLRLSGPLQPRGTGPSQPSRPAGSTSPPRPRLSKRQYRHYTRS